MVNPFFLSLFISSCFFLCFQSTGYSEIKEAGFENKHTLRVAVRDDEQDFYLVRAQGNIDYHCDQFEGNIRILPFFEYQSNLDTSSWWRRELGAEIGVDFFDDFFYYGASFQYVWQKEENYPVEALDQTMEWESRFVFTPALEWWVFKEKVDLQLFDEYTFDLTRGQATCNEIGVVLDWQIQDWLSVPVGWRHTDRIHDFDNDYLELSLLFSF